MSKNKFPDDQPPWLDPKWERPPVWPKIMIGVLAVCLLAGLWWGAAVVRRATSTLPLPTQVTITAVTTVTPTPSPDPSPTISDEPEPDPEPAPPAPPVVSVPAPQPEPTYVPPPAPDPAPPAQVGGPPVIHSVTCSRNGQSFSSQVSFNASGLAGTVTIAIGPVVLPHQFSAGTTSASASAVISSHAQTCTATLTTSYGTTIAAAQSN